MIVFQSIWWALLVTLAVETAIVALLYPGKRLKMATVCAVATSVTHMLMHLGPIHWLTSTYGTWLLVGELVATSGEAVAYQAATRASTGRALIAAGAANAASFSLALFF